MENNTTSLSWLQGLEDYLEFAQEEKSKEFINFLVKLLYSEDPIINETNSRGLVYALSVLRKYTKDDIFDTFHKYHRENHDPIPLSDAFSRGQVKSKIWLVNELSKIKNNFNCVYLLAGWFGQLRKYFDIANIKFDMMRIIDIDPEACKISDQIFNINCIDNYRVKSVEIDLTDMSWLFRTGAQYAIKNYTNGSTINEKSVPDLIINTSAEHFHEDWYHKFVNRPQITDPLFVIQSNNLHDIEEHINSVHNLREMKKKFPMSRLEYEGELELQGYKRFMLIGRP